MKQWTTTKDFINNGKIPSSAQAGFIVETEGYSSKGDGGGAQWRFTGVTGQTPSQTPAQLGDAKLTDSNGNEWAIVVFDVLNTLSLGAADGVDSTQAIAAANNSEHSHIFTPSGTYLVDHITLRGTGKVFVGAGKRATIFKHSGSGAVLNMGDLAVNNTGYLQFSKVGEFSIFGSGIGVTTNAIHIPGIIDGNPTWGVGSRNNYIEEIFVKDCDRPLKLSAWKNSFTNFTSQDTDSGPLLTDECHGTEFDNLYVVSAINEGLTIASQSPAASTTLVFKNTVVQNCGASGSMIKIQSALGVQMLGVYTERATAGCNNIIEINTDDVMIENLRYSEAQSPVTDLDMVLINGKKSISVFNATAYTQVNSVVRVTGSLPVVATLNLRQFGGVNSAVLVDESDRGKVFGTNDLVTTAYNMTVKAKTSETSLQLYDVDTDTTRHSWVGNKYTILDHELSPAGSFLNLTRGGSPSNISIGRTRFGNHSGNTIQVSGSGSPEGSLTADVGSIYMRTDGGAGTSMYVKESGSGSVGWVAK